MEKDYSRSQLEDKALKAKAAVGTLTREDLAPLLLTPLMSGNSSIKNRILEAREIIGEEHLPLTKEDRQRMEAVLYAFACKFLENADLNEVKEELSMTVLGEMIWNDGLERGMEENRRCIILNMLKRNMRDEDICAITECSQAFVDEIKREM